MQKRHLRSLRRLQRTKGRMAAIALVIAAGVGMWGGGYFAIDTVIYTRDVLVERNRLADYQVFFWPVERDELPDLSDIDGITAAEPRLILTASIEDLPGQEGALAGRAHFPSWNGQGKLTRIEIIDGRYFEGEKDAESVIIDQALRSFHGVQIGDVIKVKIGNATYERTVIGVAVSPEYLVATANPELLLPQKGSLGIVYMPKEKEDDLLGADVVTNLQLALRPGVDLAALEDTLEKRFEAVEVDRFESQSENYGYAFLQKDTEAMRQFMPAIVFVFLLVTVVVAFVILGQLIRSERQQIGTMLALGLTRTQIVASYLGAAVLVGVVGSLLGFLLTVGIGSWFIWTYSTALGLGIVLPYWQELGVLIETFLGCLAMGVGTALLSAAIPTLSLTSLAPIDAVRMPIDMPSRSRPSVLSRWLGTNAIRRFFIRNVTRNPRRFLGTVGCAAGAIAVSLAYRTTTTSIDATFNDYFATDHWNLVVEYVQPQVEQGPPRLPGIEGIVEQEEYAKGTVQVIGEKETKTLQAVGLDLPARLKTFDLDRGRVPENDAREVIIYQKLADDLGVGVGDEITVEGLSEARKYRVVGVALFFPEQIYLPKQEAQALLRQEQKVAGALVAVDPGEAARVAEEARALPTVGNVYLKSEIVGALENQSRDLLAMISVSIILSIVVAWIVLATISIVNVVEREQDYAMLRVLGFTDRDIGRGIILEIFITGAVGVLAAVPLSLVFGHFLNQRLGAAFFYIKTGIDPLSLAVIVGAALLILPFAARPSARRIQGLPLAETVRKKGMG